MNHPANRPRKPSAKHRQRAVSNPPIAFMKHKPLALDLTIKRVKLGQGRRNLLDSHAPADLAPEEKQRLFLVIRQLAPAEPIDPSNRHKDKGRQHIEKITVGNRKPPVNLVHPAQRGSATLAVV